MVQLIKNLPAMLETWVQSLVWKDSLDKDIATHSSILAWEIPWTELFNFLKTIFIEISFTYRKIHQVPVSFSKFTELYRAVSSFSLGDLPDPGIKPRFPALHTDSSLSEPPEKPYMCVCVY